MSTDLLLTSEGLIQTVKGCKSAVNISNTVRGTCVLTRFEKHYESKWIITLTLIKWWWLLLFMLCIITQIQSQWSFSFQCIHEWNVRLNSFAADAIQLCTLSCDKCANTLQHFTYSECWAGFVTKPVQHGANSQDCVAVCFYCSMTKRKNFTKTKWKCETGVTLRWFKGVFFALEVWLNCMKKGNCPLLSEKKVCILSCVNR